MRLTFNNADIPRPSLQDENRFFYLSDQWIMLRYKAISSRNNCECCGDKWTVGNPLQADHIKPRSLFPHLALELSNIQVLCRMCNMGKSNTDQTDWRKAA